MQLVRCFKKFLKVSPPAILSMAFLPFDQVSLTWDANSEADLQGYVVFWGTQSRSYSFQQDIGNQQNLTIDNLKGNNTYYFAVTAYDTAGNMSAFSNEVSFSVAGDSTPDDSTAGDDPEEPQSFAAKSYNFPNPFKPVEQLTTIRYVLAEDGPVTIKIYDLNSDLVKIILEDVPRIAGEHTEDRWNGTNQNHGPVANGVYLCRIQSGGASHFIKIAVTN